MKYAKWGIIAVVAIMVVIGLVVAGSPGRARAERFDDQRIQHLSYLQSEILTYWQAKEKLPETLSALEDDLRGVVVPKDPVTAEPYEYRTTGPLSFTLCATFALQDTEDTDPFLKPIYPAYGPYGETGERWEHEAGRTCFDRTIDPDFFQGEAPIKPS